MWRRRLIYLGLFVTALPAALGMLVVVHCVNPMALAFVTEFDVVNESGEPVHVTPVGINESGRTAPLPQYVARFPALPVVRDRDHAIATGGRLTIRYDWDDVNFTELRVRGADGVVRVLQTDPLPTTRGGYYRNRQRQYVIPPLITLPPAATPLTFNTARRNWVIWTGVGGLVVFTMLWWQLARSHRPNARPETRPTTQSA